MVDVWLNESQGYGNLLHKRERELVADLTHRGNGRNNVCESYRIDVGHLAIHLICREGFCRGSSELVVSVCILDPTRLLLLISLLLERFNEDCRPSATAYLQLFTSNHCFALIGTK